MASLDIKCTAVGITSRYGWRTLKVSGALNFHEGIDNATGGRYAHSAFATARVIAAPRTKDRIRGYWMSYGIPGVIEISHHSLDAPSPFREGQQVNMGDIIGYAGATAMAASARHIHTGLWLGGVHVDPLKYLVPGKVVTISYGGNTAASSSTPLDNTAPTPRKALPMFSVYWTGPTPSNTGQSGRLATDYGSFHIPTPQIANLLTRREAAARTGASDQMLDAEHDIINGFLRACFHSALTGITLDPNKFNVALTEGFEKLGKSILVDLTTGAEGHEIDAAELAAAFDLAIPRIVNSMLKQQGEALAAAAR